MTICLAFLRPWHKPTQGTTNLPALEFSGDFRDISVHFRHILGDIRDMSVDFRHVWDFGDISVDFRDIFFKQLI